jgi:hypothetical protein
MILQDMPVVFFDPFTKEVQVMPVEMIATYVPYATYLHLEEAARVAQIRDQEAAQNLLESIVAPYSVVVMDWNEGTGYDRLSVPFPL